MGGNVPEFELLRLSTEIVSAHVSRNTVDVDGLPDLIRLVYVALSQASTPVQPIAAPPEPAVSIKKSIFPSYLVCLEDGKKLKMLKRHLQTFYGLTPNQYRAKWQLPASYPMVAPEYAAHRSGLAKQLGLGRRPAEAEPEVQVKYIPLGVRGRKPKAKTPQAELLISGALV